MTRLIAGLTVMLLFGLCGGAARASDVFGSMYLNDALIHFIQPSKNRREVAVIMVPGLNLSSYIFVTTPDGRTGWAQMLSAAGYDVYVINDPRYDFATGGFSVPPFSVPSEGMPPADPTSEQGWQRDVWRRWGFGSSEGNPYDDTRFPTDFFDTFADNYPYLSQSDFSFSDAIGALLEQLDSVWLMAHSAGGPAAVEAARQHTGKVNGFLMIEPTNPPDDADFPALAGLSLFGVYGDYIESRNQGGRKEGTEYAASLFAANGGSGLVVSLPDDYGINGNTHLMMQDNNNDFIAGLVLDWLDAFHPLPVVFADGFEE